MEGISNLETKYQNLATEYSKLRANATVLKKAVLDEQARSRELKDQLKEYEQRLRKSNQEMESLTFRNQQLTKRISVLQEELNTKQTTNTKRVRGKSVDNSSASVMPTNVTLLDEELQKKIIDNAQLISTIADKDFEISKFQECLHELEHKLELEVKHRTEQDLNYKLELKKLHFEHSKQLKECNVRSDSTKQNGDLHSDRGSVVSSDDGISNNAKQLLELEQQSERWKTEFELLKAVYTKNDSGDDSDKECKLKEFFFEKINDLCSEKQEAQSLADSLAAECNALQIRLELSLDEKTETENRMSALMETLDRLQEELTTTSHNYEQQLSTMSEHLADLNDKYTEQCEVIQQLQYQLGVKGKKK